MFNIKKKQTRPKNPAITLKKVETTRYTVDGHTQIFESENHAIDIIIGEEIHKEFPEYDHHFANYITYNRDRIYTFLKNRKLILSDGREIPFAIDLEDETEQCSQER